MIYKVGNKKDLNVILNDERDINQLNILQFLNCLETVYFNENCTEHYIKTLFDKSLKYKKY